MDSITVVLDRSGSMGPTWGDTVGGLKQFLKDQVSLGRPVSLNITVFDDKITEFVRNADATVEFIDGLNLPKPRGFTALYDAIGRTATRLGEDLAKTPAESVYFIVVTDGIENHSTEYGSDQIKEIIKHQTDVYKWNFVFLGADKQAVTDAVQLGFSKDASSNYSVNNYAGAFHGTSQAMLRGRYAGGQSISYTAEEREAMC